MFGQSKQRLIKGGHLYHNTITAVAVVVVADAAATTTTMLLSSHIYLFVFHM